jgi:hypothetical protein
VAEWQLEREPGLDGFTVEWASEAGLVLARRNILYRAASANASPVRLGAFRAPRLLTELTRARVAQRFLRLSYYNVAERADGSYFLSFAKSTAVLQGGEVIPLDGLLRPTRVLRNACATDEQGDLYFGEYLTNAERGPIHIYRLPAGSTRLEVAHRFDAGEIRHVHGIYHDPYEGGLWCVTGDVPSECRILRSFDGFRTMELVGGGDETWRAVSLVFTPDAIFYGSDAEFRPNSLYRLDRKRLTRDEITPVGGPVYYSTKSGDDLFFGTAVEFCPSETDRRATVWHVNASGNAAPVASYLKDRLPMGPFLAGTINFAGGPGVAGEVYFHGVGLKGSDGRVHRLRRVPPSVRR